MSDEAINETSDEDKSTKFDYGPIRSYEVTWKSGHIETVQAHQVTLPSDGFFGRSSTWVTFHGEVDGCWHLVLRAKDEDILSIRMLTESDHAV